MQLLGVSFGEGNDKLGAVFTFSLPSKITCPVQVYGAEPNATVQDTNDSEKNAELHMSVIFH